MNYDIDEQELKSYLNLSMEVFPELSAVWRKKWCLAFTDASGFQSLTMQSHGVAMDVSFAVIIACDWILQI